MKKENIIKIIGLIIIVLVITTISSYAYFTAGISGGENNTTLSVSGGTMNIVYSSENKITLSGIYPREEAWATKTFTLTGNNTTGADMTYNMSLVVESNTFFNSSLKFSLTGTNPGNNGAVALDVIKQDILNGPSEMFLGNGIFEGPTTNKVHVYSLSIFYPSRNISQNVDQGKSFDAYVNVESGSKSLTEIVLLSDGGIERIHNKEDMPFLDVGLFPDLSNGYEFISKEVNKIQNVESEGLFYTQETLFSEQFGVFELIIILDENGSPIDKSTGEFYTKGLEFLDSPYIFKSSDIGKYYMNMYSAVGQNVNEDGNISMAFDAFYKINAVENGAVTSATLYKGKQTYDGLNQGLFKMEDDYGISYYFRGAKDYVNNNIIFAEHQWKIIRINGDGSLRIIYNGTCPDNSCEINTTNNDVDMMLSSTNELYDSEGRIGYNLNNDDNKYVGYMYGGLNGEASTSRSQAVTNETSSNIKLYLDSWYEENISGKSYEKYITDILFCNDRQLESEVGGSATGTGFGTSETYYAPYHRLEVHTLIPPSLKCNSQNDRFTSKEYSNALVPGNNALDYPIGLITGDEVALLGLGIGYGNLKNYLDTYWGFWTISPYGFNGSIANVWDRVSRGIFSSIAVNVPKGVRGVLNLASNTPITGTGTTLDPYIVLD